MKAILFKNNKTKESHPDFRGFLGEVANWKDENFIGIAAWIKETKQGEIYLSMRIEVTKNEALHGAIFSNVTSYSGSIQCGDEKIFLQATRYDGTNGPFFRLEIFDDDDIIEHYIRDVRGQNKKAEQPTKQPTEQAKSKAF